MTSFSRFPRRLRKRTPRVFEYPSSYGTEDETANVGQICHTTALDVSHGTGLEELNEEPEAN